MRGTSAERLFQPFIMLLVVFLVIATLPACLPAEELAQPISLRITSPASTTTVLQGDRVSVCTETRGGEPIAGIDLLVNGLIVSGQDFPGISGRPPLYTCQEWRPVATGRHTVLAQARLFSGETIRSMPHIIQVAARPTATLPAAQLTPRPTPTSQTPTPPASPVATLALPASDTPTSPAVTATPLPAQPPATPTLIPTQPILPIVQVLSPSSGAKVLAGQTIDIRAAFSASRGVTRIELWANGVLIPEERYELEPRLAATATLRWKSLSPGLHKLFVRAFDAGGLWADSETITLEVVENLSPPQVWISEPRGRPVVYPEEVVEFKASATDPVGVVRIELWVDGKRHASISSPNAGGQSPFSGTLNWTASSKGQHEAFVRAVSASTLSTDSNPLVVVVADPTLPSIALNVSPRTIPEGEKARIDVLAMANYGITQIELYVDELPFARQQSPSPDGEREMMATFFWDAALPGPHSVFAVIHDIYGRTSSTERLDIRVVRAAAATATPTPEPAPAPTAEILSPVSNFRHSRSVGALRVHFEARSTVALQRVELWYRFAGEPATLIRSEDGRGIGFLSASWDWLPPRTGEVQITARAYDTAGRSASSQSIAGVISE